jgi:type IX secretion system PorP/SprF family membrane protein
MKRLSLIITCLLLTLNTVMSQESEHMDLYMYYQPYINVASMGGYSDLNGSLFYRHQWAGFEGSPKIGGAHVFSPLKYNNYLGGGIIYQTYGIYQIVDVTADYAYRIKFNEDIGLSLGLGVGVQIRQNDYEELDVVDPSDPLYQIPSTTKSFPLAEFGLYFNWKSFYVGFAMPNMIGGKIVTVDGKAESDIYFSFKEMPYYVQLGYPFDFSENFSLNTSFLLKAQPQVPVQLDFNVEFYFVNLIGVGLTYRTKEEISALLRLNIKEVFGFHYAFNWTFNNISNNSGGSHEIMLTYTVPNKKNSTIIKPRF